VLGLSPAAVQQQLAAARQGAASGSRGAAGGGGDSTAGSDSAGHASLGAAPSATGSQAQFRRAGARSGRGQAQGLGARYIVFAKRNGKPTPVWIRTGLTDMDYSEVLDGLTASDSVYILPSASLVQSQQDMRERINRVTGGGGVPGMRQQTTQPSGGGRP
jgi:hypothetical protein